MEAVVLVDSDGTKRAVVFGEKDGRLVDGGIAANRRLFGGSFVKDLELGVYNEKGESIDLPED